MANQFEGIGMPTRVRAKFSVTKIEQYNPGSRLVVLKPVYSQDPNHENKSFWDATPTGELTMTVNNPRAGDYFRIGEEYYLDFTMAAGYVEPGSKLVNETPIPARTT